MVNKTMVPVAVDNLLRLCGGISFSVTDNIFMCEKSQSKMWFSDAKFNHLQACVNVLTQGLRFK